MLVMGEPVAFHHTQDPISGAIAPAIGHQSQVSVLACVPIQEVGKRTGVSTTDIRAGIGIGNDGDPMFTLQANAQPGVVCTTGDVTHSLTHEGFDASEDGTGRGTPIIASLVGHGEYREALPTLRATGGDTGGGGEALVFNETGHEKWKEESIAGSLNAHEAREAREAHTIVTDREHATIGALCAAGGKSELHGSQATDSGHHQVSAGIPRRLMPVECERLMGWEDGWTDVPDANGKPPKDAPRYKACGNGVVSSVPAWIGTRLLTLHAELPA